MLCDKCKKNEASIFIERSINGNKENYSLCSHCAAQMENDLPFTLDLGGLLSGFSHYSPSPLSTSPVCSSCGMTFENFEKIGRLGCANCYSDFRDQLTPIVKRIHGSGQHTGYEGIVVDKKKLEIQELKAKLSEAILKENFEDAAMLRDKIKALEEVEKSDSVDK